jgi:thiol-disulfide isomerase/thioredoxin
VLNSDKPVILEISSTSCPPCLVMIPTLISIAKNYSDIKLQLLVLTNQALKKSKTLFLFKHSQLFT